MQQRKACKLLIIYIQLPVKGNVYWDLFQEGNQNYQEGNKEAIWVAQIDYDAYKAEDGQSKLQ